VAYGIACACAIVAGSALPLNTLFFGELLDSFGTNINSDDTTQLTGAILKLCPVSKWESV
jgi:hypothetical protein